MGNNKALENKLLFFETCARNNDNNIAQIKQEFCELILNDYDTNSFHPGIQLPKKAIQLGQPINEENVFNECCCCS